MRAILVDDENPALLQLERLIQVDGRIEVAGKFTRVREALEHAAGSPLDIAFLDIEMPGLNGLEAAEHLNSLHPGIHVVFVTAYNQYAIEAFEVNAVDYLLKPVDPERFAKTVSRLEARLASQQLAEASVRQEPKIICFQRLEVLDGTGSGSRLKWRTQKAQELFALLVHHRNRWVAKDQILMTLWPELSADKAVTQLHTSVYQVRKMLKSWGLGSTVDYSHESYCLVQREVEVDVDRFLRDTAMEEIRDLRDLQRLQNGLAQYQGDYLEEHDYAWALSVREELRRQFVCSSLLAADYEQTVGQARRALDRLLGLQSVEPFSDEVCRKILLGHLQIGEISEAQRHYDMFVRVLSEELDAEPEMETVMLAEKYFEAGRASRPGT
ncbi:response regulator [Paenibacillus sp. XY044]|uniref:response regulator n=1 Tax=Paenibacillus sp. XY044 TaxID=2026089 RepID=UPI000B982F73|nr:response regulator [Paenibacillus sp. XY044]OZB94370.1 response regulator receiver protein [Paenibacillus sp. XY044]